MIFENRKHILVLLLPALLIMALLAVYPILSVLYNAFMQTDPASKQPQFVGWDNFRELFGDFFFVYAIKNTFVFTVVASIAQVLLGVWLALIFRPAFPGRRWAMSLLIYPMMIATLVCSSIWRAWYNYDFGFLNTLLVKLGLPPQEWLFNPHMALYAIALVDTWQWTPMVFLLILAALQSIPKDIADA